MWVFYARLKTDTALELMFNTDTKNEVLFLLTKGGDRIAVAFRRMRKAIKKAGFTRGLSPQTAMALWQSSGKPLMNFRYRAWLLTIPWTTPACDGLTMGLYRKLEKAIGAEVMAKVKRCSYSMLEELRAVKTPSEIEIMKECSRITTDIYDSLFKRIHVGLSEIDVAKIMMEECEKRTYAQPWQSPGISAGSQSQGRHVPQRTE